MPGRKKKEAVEESTDTQAVEKKPAAKKPVAKKPKVVEAVAEAQAPETVGVPVEMLSQLMAQIQTLTQEVGQLKAQVHEPVSNSVSVVEEPIEAVSLGQVTQAEIDAAELTPDLMPDNFFAEELPDEPVEASPIDTEVFEEKNPGLLAEIESFNDGPGIDVREALSLGELSQAEIDEATANPVQMPDDFYAMSEEDEAPVEPPEVDQARFEEQNPGLLAEIESFNLDLDGGIEGDAITAEEAGALLAGFDEAMKDNAPVEETGDLSADDIAAMFASAEPQVVTEPVAEEGGDLSAEDIAAMFASAEPEVVAEPVAEAVEESGDLSADEIAAMFASAEPEVVAEPVLEPADDGGVLSADEIAAMLNSAETMSDDDIAQAVDAGASEPMEAGFDGFDLSDDDLDGLTEEDLVALVRQNIDAQADEIAEAESFSVMAEEAILEEEPAASSDGGGVMSAAEIAALLQTPDAEGDVVPSESSAMSDDELRALLLESSEAEPEAPVPTADDIDNTISFVQEEEQPVAEPIMEAKPQPKPRQSSAGSEPEIGAIKAVPSHLAIRAMALPMRFEEGKILCLVAEPVDQAAIDRLSKETGFGIVVEKAPIDQVISGLRVAYAELQDSNARFAVMSGAQKRPTLVEKVAGMWKKSA